MKKNIGEMASNSPILLIVFNRPEKTKIIFEKLREIEPKRLYVAFDGPRDGNKADFVDCATVKKIVSGVDWECEVVKLEREKNLGCKFAVSSAIDWFFVNEEQGIILEDDCLPSTSFFQFCNELLREYKYDPRIMAITGFCEDDNKRFDHADYFYSNLGSVWGWATWRRAWSFYDIEMTGLEAYIERGLLARLYGEEGHARGEILKSVKRGKIDTWDYQWSFAINKNGGLCIVPCLNLVRNIGFGVGATHTTKSESRIKKINEIHFPLKHNLNFNACNEYDYSLLHREKDIGFGVRKILNKILRKTIDHRKKNTKNVWEDSEYFDREWTKRIEKMSSFLDGAEKSVCDFGCGPQWLRKYIPKKIEYVGVDYKNRGFDTVVCDINNKELPEECFRNDVIFCSGFLEYVEDLDWFIKSVCQTANKLICSYCSLDSVPSINQRVGNGWVNHLHLEEIINIVLSNNFSLINIERYNGNTLMSFKKIKNEY
jgi:hypothetical protein